MSAVSIELFEEEYVVPRGTAEVHWFVRFNDAWIHCASYPGAAATRLESGAHVVYRTRVDLEVPLETRLMRVESRPKLMARRSTLEHLMKPKHSIERQTFRTYYRVARGGRLGKCAAEL